jgi:hypothetical protein
LIGLIGATGLRGASGAGIVGATGLTGATGPVSVSSAFGENVIINGGFDFFQRNTNGSSWTPLSSADDTYCFDRWIALTQSSTVLTSRIAPVTGTAAPPGPFCGLMQQSAAQRIGLLQIVEGVNSFPLRGQSITLQAAAMSAANATPFNLHFAILEWTGVADTVTSDVVRDWASTTYTPNNFFLSSGIIVASAGLVSLTSGVRNSITLTTTISSSCNNLIVFFWTDTTQIGTKLYLFDVDCHTGGTRVWSQRPIAQELVLCQRYYEKSYLIDIKPGTVTTAGMCQGWVNPNSYGWFKIPQVHNYLVSKRIAIAPIFYSPHTGVAAKVGEYSAGSVYVADRNAGIASIGNNSYSISWSGSGTEWTGNNYIWHHWAVDAEL